MATAYGRSPAAWWTQYQPAPPPGCFGGKNRPDLAALIDEYSAVFRCCSRERNFATLTQRDDAERAGDHNAVGLRMP
jgi:hypothetical protein